MTDEPKHEPLSDLTGRYIEVVCAADGDPWPCDSYLGAPMLPADFGSCLIAAVSDVFEDATMGQCQDVHDALKRHLAAAARFDPTAKVPTTETSTTREPT